MICCYAPYNTFDPQLVVDRNQIVALRSDDQGQTWRHNSMIRFDSEYSTGAEAWVIELADGRLLGTTWHLNQEDKSDHPNAYAISLDGGDTWQPTRSTGIMGQSTSLAALPDGRALFIYNQRRHGEPGVWMAVVQPDGGRLRRRVERDRLARADTNAERQLRRTQRMDRLLVRRAVP